MLVNNTTNINKNQHFSPQTIKHKKILTYDIGNPDSGLGQAQKCGEIKPVVCILGYIPAS